jgi:hypothetical protein
MRYFCLHMVAAFGGTRPTKRFLDEHRLVRVARVLVDDGMVEFIETPFENVTEAGVRLPAPGEDKGLARTRWRSNSEGQTMKLAGDARTKHIRTVPSTLRDRPVIGIPAFSITNRTVCIRLSSAF